MHEKCAAPNRRVNPRLNTMKQSLMHLVTAPHRMDRVKSEPIEITHEMAFQRGPFWTLSE